MLEQCVLGRRLPVALRLRGEAAAAPRAWVGEPLLDGAALDAEAAGAPVGTGAA